MHLRVLKLDIRFWFFGAPKINLLKYFSIISRMVAHGSNAPQPG
jgi:hypothetical protein